MIYRNDLLTDCKEIARRQEVEEELAFEREMLGIKGEIQDLDSFATERQHASDKFEADKSWARIEKLRLDDLKRQEEEKQGQIEKSSAIR